MLKAAAKTRNRRSVSGWVAALVLIAVAVVLDAVWIEPHHLLRRDLVTLEGGPRSGWVHLSDLHVARVGGRERRLIETVEAERPAAILISGDLVSDSHHAEVREKHTSAAAAVVRDLRRIAPVFAVQGHSEYHGSVVAALEDAGVRWLSNQGTVVGPPPGVRVLGLNQQVGGNLGFQPLQPTFSVSRIGGESAAGKTDPKHANNTYLHWDPNPPSLTDTGGPLSWGNYELSCEIQLGDRASEVGVAVHSRYPVGDDRLIRFRRHGPGEPGEPTTFVLVPHGSGFDRGEIDSGVDPEPRRWYRLKVRTSVSPRALRVEAKVWPADVAEPDTFQAWAEDHSPRRVIAGTVGLWARGGTAHFRRLTVTAPDGSMLLEDSLEGAPLAPGWREGTRATRLALALARSPQAPGAPTVVLSHVPSAAVEAAHKGLDLVLAGHTHGGQVRLPGRALLTRSSLGPHYSRGLFQFASGNRRGWTDLYVNSGIGTSLLPIRFLCPPTYARLEIGAGPGPR